MAGSLIPANKHSGPLRNKKAEAERLGRKAAVYGAGTVVGAAVLGAIWFPLGLIGGLAGLGFTAKHTYEWLQFRGKWGLRF